MLNGEVLIVYLDVLNDNQRRILSLFSDILKDTDFYLAGGTALALQIGHRISVDLDWFVPVLGDTEKFLNLIKSSIDNFYVTSISSETVYLMIDNVQVSFIGYNYPNLQPKITFNEYSIYLASPDDLACMKLSAIAGRGAKKDFIDLYFLIKYFKPLKIYLDLYREKFSTRDVGHVIRSLVYFKDAEREPDVKMLKELSWNNLKRDFETWVNVL
jgi:hypothetical protein